MQAIVMSQSWKSLYNPHHPYLSKNYLDENPLKMWKYQLKVVLWKNWIIRKRHWILTLFESFVPVLLFILVAYGRSNITSLSKKHVVNVTENEKIPILYEQNPFNLAETYFLYTPDNPYFNDIMHRVQEKFQFINNYKLGFGNENQLLNFYNNNNNHTVLAVVFNSKAGNKKLDYSILFNRPYLKTSEPYENQFIFQPGRGSTYLWGGLLYLQKALDMSFIEKEKESQNGQMPEITLLSQEFPYPPHTMDSGLPSMLMSVLPLITLFSFIFAYPAVLKRVVQEKHSGIRELMRMVGMKPWMILLGWFIYSILPMMLSVIIIVIILKVDLFDAGYPPIEYSNAGVLFLFLFLYCAALTAFCFFLSTFFNRPNIATVVGLLISILSYVLPAQLLEGKRVPYAVSLLLLLFPNMGLHFGYTAISQYEIRNIGVHFSNWWSSGAKGENDISMFIVCVMLVFDCLLFILVALYTFDTSGGSIFSPFRKIVTFITRRNSVDHSSEDVESMNLKEKDSYTTAIELIHLTKVYRGNPVVKDLSIGIPEKEITILLGHNGAGKSTTMGMITGMIRRTRGQIKINGKEIHSISDLAEPIGLCTQHNLFFPDLTVTEHMIFFALLKGKTFREAKAETNFLLDKMNLTDKHNEMAEALSGGMKRKLCLGMAVVGGSKILILDEPSSGMDPQSRREMWDLLLEWRREKTILITTHFMEEADALGDRIAIMNGGRLMCFDRPMSLKKLYDTGYNLVLLIEKDDQLNIDDTILKLKEIIKTFVSNVKLKGVNGNEVEFLLPFGDNDSYIKNYIEMFEYLENYRKELHVENISFTHTTLEDVFLNARIQNEIENGSEENTEPDGIESIKSDDTDYYLTSHALLYKRFRCFLRNLLSFSVAAVIAIFLLVLCILLSMKNSTFMTPGGQALKVSLNFYGRTKVFYNATENPNAQSIMRYYLDAVSKENDYEEVSDVGKAIIVEGVNNLPFYQQHLVVAAELTTTNQDDSIEATLLYNNFAIHSAPISLNLITTSLAKFLLGDQYSISTSFKSLDFLSSMSNEELSGMQVGLLWSVIMPIGVLLFVGCFIYFPYSELSTRFTQIQFMCGVPPWVYWLVTYVSDLIIYVVFVLLLSLISMFWVPFQGQTELGHLFLIFFVYGLAAIPFSYLFSRKKSMSDAFAVFIVTGVMLGIVLTVLVVGLEQVGKNYATTMTTFKTLFLIFCPPFAMTYLGLKFSMKVIENYNWNNMEDSKRMATCSFNSSNPCCISTSQACVNFQSYESILKPDIYLILLGALLYLLLNIALDSYLLKKVINFLHHLYYTKTKRTYSEIDSENVYGTLRVKALKKSYSGREVVKNISLDLKRGECMGILGVNGAGKTTTFKMLTREEVKDNGTIKIDDINIEDNKYLMKLGYCPQNDALNFSLTARDILKTMAMLRGISNNKVNVVVDHFLDMFGLTEFADIPCEQYSGGNKRKLSFAVAVIGYPDFILLDEPTNGVDPLSRRKFWTLIKKIKEKQNNSFILTSHSMAECEAVCNDLKIMKAGTIHKEGTISKLKNDIAGFNIRLKLKQEKDISNEVDEVDGVSAPYDEVDGITKKNNILFLPGKKKPKPVIVKSSYSPVKASKRESPDGQSSEKYHLASSSAESSFRLKTGAELRGFLKQKYTNGEFRDEHGDLLHFYIRDKSMKWSRLFREFEDLKESNPDLIEDYSISEASLEEVFLDVARSDSDKLAEV
ncbi:phospholipid-transporting ATPase ABCA3-like isoform X2 [Anthonomus grandis grandis]|uniref:phospholipid-transporting ATPase ABCA3-like isoform X2 n=1 Tax=Anthonomus grandis grandis TaxID=2921223 RepID=UPI00216510F1|nr:phospholipid-transporting ATPase ABCA3-like isoform X2 [Anthonomus grandis grandis]